MSPAPGHHWRQLSPASAARCRPTAAAGCRRWEQPAERGQPAPGLEHCGDTLMQPPSFEQLVVKPGVTASVVQHQQHRLRDGAPGISGGRSVGRRASQHGRDARADPVEPLRLARRAQGILCTANVSHMHGVNSLLAAAVARTGWSATATRARRSCWRSVVCRASWAFPSAASQSARAKSDRRSRYPC